MYLACAILLLILLGMLWYVMRLRQQIKQLVAERQKPAAQDPLGTLAGGIAHDFNNILGSILGFGVLLEEDLASDKNMQEMARQITTAARRGQNIVAQLMNYSRKSAGNGTKHHETVFLDGLIRENIALLQPCIGSSTRIEYSSRAPSLSVFADSTQIGQALVNLCVNADHAIGVRNGTIAITLDQTFIPHAMGSREMEISGDDPFVVMNGQIRPGNHARISVTDNGHGMSREIAARIFDPFFTTKDVDSGTGLGLAALQGIIRDHNGAVRVTTAPYKGTMFEIFLPIPDSA